MIRGIGSFVGLVIIGVLLVRMAMGDMAVRDVAIRGLVIVVGLSVIDKLVVPVVSAALKSTVDPPEPDPAVELADTDAGDSAD